MRLLLALLLASASALRAPSPRPPTPALQSGTSSIANFLQRTRFTAFCSSSLQMSSPREIIENSIANNKVMVFSKSYCPYCDRAKAAIKDLGVSYGSIELDVRT
jgi:thioredoxin-related protein